MSILTLPPPVTISAERYDEPSEHHPATESVEHRLVAALKRLQTDMSGGKPHWSSIASVPAHSADDESLFYAIAGLQPSEVVTETHPEGSVTYDHFYDSVALGGAHYTVRITRAEIDSDIMLGENIPNVHYSLTGAPCDQRPTLASVAVTQAAAV